MTVLKVKNDTTNSGMALHVNHDTLFKWCWGLKERIKVIDTDKPENERATRKRLLRILTKKEVAMLPKDFVEICRIEGEANQKWWEAYQNWGEAYIKYKPQLEKVHKKICGCKEWNGRKLVFNV